MTSLDALTILDRLMVHPATTFDNLSITVKSDLMTYATYTDFKCPKDFDANQSWSTARCFHAEMIRAINSDQGAHR